MELLTVHAAGLGLFEIADQLHIPRSVTHRILTVLAARGYVRQDRYHGAYRLTTTIATIVAPAWSGRQQDIVNTAPELPQASPVSTVKEGRP